MRIVYAVQNVGGIDFDQDVGDTVPVKYTIRGLQEAGHVVDCLKLEGRSVIGIKDVFNPENFWNAPLGFSKTRIFLLLESGIRRLQRELHIPYYAFFDLFRFYEASTRTLSHYDLCHEHNGLFCAGAALACWQQNIPYILTFSADPFFERNLVGKPLRGLHSMVAKSEARWAFKIAKKIICVSTAAKRQLIDTWQIDPEKIVVMPNGVDTTLFHPGYDPRSVRAELCLDGEPTVGFVGGFQPWHGLELLIESFARVIREIPTAKLLLIGDGRARTSVDQKINDLGVQDSVIVTGMVPQSRVPEFLSVTDLAVLPYPKLPQELWFSPLKLYEYMAAGKAIVASKAGQISEVIQHGYTGFLVEPGDIDSLANALIALLKDPQRRQRLGDNARRQAVEKHSWDQYIARLEAIYLNALQPSRDVK